MLKKYISHLLFWLFACNMVSIGYANTIAAPLKLPVASKTLTIAEAMQGSKMPQIQAGVHYKRLSEKICSNTKVKQLTSSNADKIQVTMFFSYGCSVCRVLNKPFDEWASKQDKNKLNIFKLPVSFNRGWASLAQAFFTVQSLHKSDTLDEIIFSGIHDKAMPLWAEKPLEDLFFNNGVDRSLFKNTFHSFNVNNQVKWANDLSLAFELSAIPNIIIIGPYNSYNTNLSMTTDPKFLFAVIDYLVKKELKSST